LMGAFFFSPTIPPLFVFPSDQSERCAFPYLSANV
jgi:hypothetical protein